MHLTSVTAKSDSGASKTYVQLEVAVCLKYIALIIFSVLGLPNKSSCEINRAGNLALHCHLSQDAQARYVLDNLKVLHCYQPDIYAMIIVLLSLKRINQQ